MYFSYDGMLEPLGQSQVLAYLELLSADHNIYLVSYEKPGDLMLKGNLLSMKRRLEVVGIRWYQLKYHKRPSGLATSYDILRGIFLGLRLTIMHNVDVIHARSYVPSVIALTVKKLTGCKYIFDMRGFWADERVDGGLWPDGGRMFRLAKWFERKFLLNADHVVSLTKAAVIEMESFDYLDGNMPPVTVIPTCVDIDTFFLMNTKKTDTFTLGYVGSVGTWYLFEYVVEAFKLLLFQVPTANLLVLNRGEHDYIREELERQGVSSELYSIQVLEHAEIPVVMSRMQAGIFFIKPLYSKMASAPTKLGEFLSCGIPCISNEGVGDMGSILTDEKVGVAVGGFSQAEIEDGVRKLISLVDDSGIAQRCRDSAKLHFSLEKGVGSYREIYKSLL